MTTNSPKRPRVKAQWGVDQFGDHKTRLIPRAIVADSADRLGIAGWRAMIVMAKMLQAIDADYHREKESFARTPSRGASRAAVREIVEQASQLADKLYSMDTEAGWSLIVALHLASDVERDQGGVSFLDKLTVDLRALARASNFAARTLSEGSDKRPLVYLEAAVSQLVALWEQQTGQIFGFERDEGSGAPASIGGIFIVAVMRWIDEAASAVQIMTALRKIARSRKKTSP